MNTLTAADRAMFESLRIPLDLVERAGVSHVTDREAREKYGTKGAGDMAGIVFPYFDPKSGHRWTARLRRDNPEIENGKPKNKYISAYGDRRHLFFPPNAGDLWNDHDLLIVFVESEKAALALMAWAERMSRRLLAIAMGGCWGWRGRIGKAENSNGDRVDELGPLEDLLCASDGRKAYVLLDSNVLTNPKVQQAQSALVRQLRKQGADVQVVDLPAEDGVNGPDDYIGLKGDEAMAGLFDAVGSGSKILDDVEDFIRRFVILSSAQSGAVALWVIHTYVFRSSAWTPYLNVTSAAPECGKSLLLEVLELLVDKPWKIDGASPAVLFRKIERVKPTVLFDELDTTLRGDKETAQAIRQVLNSGAKYNGVVARCVGPNHEPKDFVVFCPKVLAGIGGLPDTVASRSLPIRLDRKLASEKVEYLDHDDPGIRSRVASLRREISIWSEKRADGLKHADPEFPSVLTARQKDGARTMLAIADAAGSGWPFRARALLCELHGDRPTDDLSIGVQVLRDIRAIFDEIATDTIASADLIEKLTQIETSPWAEWKHGKPMTPTSLSRLLKPFRIFSKTVRLGVRTPKGYDLDSFEDAWNRYLPARIDPSPPLPNATPPQTNVYAGPEHFSETQQDLAVAPSKNEESSMSTRVVADVAGQNGENGHTELILPCEIHGRHADWWTKILSDGGEMICGKCESQQ